MKNKIHCLSLSVRILHSKKQTLNLLVITHQKEFLKEVFNHAELMTQATVWSIHLFVSLHNLN